jgi:hypothetical protein
VTVPEDPIMAPATTTAPPQRMSRYLLAIGLVVMLAGLLFGYDQGVIWR